MDNKYIISNSNDFFSFFKEVHNFKINEKGIYTHYHVNEDIGDGHMDKIDFNNGLEFCITDIYLKKNIRLYYSLVNPPLEIHYMYEGNIFHDEKNKGNLNLSAGCMSVFFSDFMSGSLTYVAQRRIASVTIMINDKLLANLLNSCGYVGDINDFRKNNDIRNLIVPSYPTAELKAVFHQILSCKLYDTTKLMVLQSKAFEAIAHIFNTYFFNCESKKCEIYLNRQDKKALEKVKTIIENNCGSTKTIKQLSKEVGLNEYKLKNGFKHIYKSSIRTYYKRCRMIKAKQLLEEQDYTVTQAAIEVGYTNISYFAKEFKEYYGDNPKNFRFRM